MLAIRNALRYFPAKHHEVLAREFAEELHKYSLEPDELAAGYVLSCQALPLTSDVVVDFDAKGMA